MIPTPDLSHLTKDDLRRVYDPAEDTFLLLDALEQDANYLRGLKPRVCVEVGSGSGCVSAFLGSILKDLGSLIISTDINPHAAKCTAATGLQNGVRIDPVICDLVAPFLPRLSRKVDVLIFNPPYVPTEEEEVLSAQAQGDIAGAWAGGFDGMVITNRLLDELGNLLSPLGHFYLVALKQNDPDGIIRRMENEQDMVGKIDHTGKASRPRTSVYNPIYSSVNHSWASLLPRYPDLGYILRRSHLRRSSWCQSGLYIAVTITQVPSLGGSYDA